MSFSLEQLTIETIRFMAADTVQAASSGHPGTPMGAAAIAYTLWNRHLRHNPANPSWFNRDRFILSPGHASALLYALLHLTGYNLPLDELKRFRQWGSLTPGHPEYGLTPGVEVTSGPLGQGFANGVGMAIAERWLAARFNRPGYTIIDHYTYAIVSDGDLQEGVSGEAASLAGTLKLGKLIYLYDSNGIQIEGSTEIAFQENVGQRFEAYGWQVIGPMDGHDLTAIDAAIRAGQEEEDRPTLIICRTHIGYGAPTKQDTAAAHGEPLGEAELAAAKQAAGWDPQRTFTVSDDVLIHMRRALQNGQTLEDEWQASFTAWKQAYPVEAKTFEDQVNGVLPAGWDENLSDLFHPGDKPMATREASGRVLNALADKLPALMGGSADLSPSTKTILKGKGDFSALDHSGRNLHFGVREHAMGSIANGMALHGGVIPYTATFLVFADYMRPTLRLAALMEQRVIFIFTHDSIGLGEDGPTHQPVEQLLSLRAIPNLVVIRPADAIETAEAWRFALQNQHTPTALVLSRQNLPLLQRASNSPGLEKGAYILWESGNDPQVILMSSGSEVQYALAAGKTLAEQGIQGRVVSFPSWELFEKQSQEYKESVLPNAVRARLAIEAATSLGWERYVGLDGLVIGMDRFGASAPAGVLYEKFGFKADRIIERALQVIERQNVR
jgi:transketolase